MAMSNYSTERLRSLIQATGGLSASNRYTVELPDISGMPTPDNSEIKGPTLTQDLPILCTSAQIPGKQLNVLSREIGTGTKSVANGQVFTAVNLSFYLTNDYAVRKYFQYWLSCVVSQDEKQAMYAGYYNNYARGDVTIHQLARDKDTIADAVYSVSLINAFPTQMELIQLNNQAQTAAMEMTVSLAYKTYKVLPKKKN